MPTGTIILPIPPQAYDPTNPAGLEHTAAARPYLTFDDTTDELVIWSFRMPQDYASALVAKIQYSMASATTLEVIFAVEVMAVTDGEDVDTDSYDTANPSSATTVPGTAGLMDEISITLNNDDGVAAGDYVSIRLRRDADNVGDDASADAEVWAVSLEYTTS